MDTVFSRSNLQDILAMADSLAVVVLLGAVAAAASLSVTRGINTCLAEASSNQPPKADDFMTAWLDSLTHAAVPSVAALQAVPRLDQRGARGFCAPGPTVGFSSMVVEP
jgi:hypothetical protein